MLVAVISYFALCVISSLSLTRAEPNTIKYTVVEELDGKKYVGNPIQDAKIKITEPNNDVTYSFLDPNKPQLVYFDIRKFSGDLYLKKVLDRETACNIDVCPVEFDVAVQSASGFFEVVHVIVLVTDINDNYPEFPEPRVTLTIPENSERKSTFRVIGATDSDTYPAYKVKTYRLEDSIGGLFGLKKIKNPDASVDVGIVLNRVIDRETKPSRYKLVVIAADGGIPPKSGSVIVEVVIGDANDHTPVFEKRQYKVDIDEHVAINHPVIRVRASDKDLGLNAVMVYKFTDKTQELYGRLFSINETTGEIFVTGNLDYESKTQKRVFQLIVQASDRGSQPRTSKTLVIVQLVDKNDNPPVIKFNLLAGNNHSIVSENAKVGAYVGHVSVVDADQDGKQRVLCHITNPTFSLQKLSRMNSFKIVVNAPLDREKIDEYNITLKCEDTGFPRQLASAFLRVMVKDENDHAPSFKPSRYDVKIKENYKQNKPILQVTATDEDIGFNGKIMYSVDAKVKHLLEVNSFTGTLYAINTLDREVNPVIDFKVWANDRGDPSMSSAATIIITLIDENDVVPSFLKDIYSFSVMENKIAGSVIGNVNATDGDLGPGGDFRLSIVKDTNYESAFSISNSGEVTAMKMFDREVQSAYQFLITATDNGEPKLTGTTTVIVTVDDVNDNPPDIRFPNAFNNSVNVPHTLKRGDHIVTISANDRDDNDNGRLTYEILHVKNRNYKQIFEMDNVSGEIVVTTDLHLYHADNYEMVINVSDHGNPKLSTVRNLNIRVFIMNTTEITTTESGSLGVSRNTIIIVTLAVITVVLVVLIIAAIYVIKKKDVRKHNYRAKSEEQKIIRQTGNLSATTSSAPSDNSIVALKNPKIFPQACSSLIHSTSGSGLADGKNQLQGEHTKILRGERAYMQMIEEDGEKNKSKSIADTSRASRKLDDTISDDSNDTTVTNDSGQGGSEEDIRMNKGGFYVREKDRIAQRLSSNDHYDDRYHGGCYRYPSSSDADSQDYVSRNPRGDSEYYDMSKIHAAAGSTPTTNNLTQTSAMSHTSGGASRCFNRNIDLSTDSVTANTRNAPRNGPRDVADTNNGRQKQPGAAAAAFYDSSHRSHPSNNANATNSAKHQPTSRQTSANNCVRSPNTSHGPALYNMTTDSERGQVYSIADIDGLVDSRAVKSHDDDAATTTSGSYTINPDELVNEINDLFFNDVIV